MLIGGLQKTSLLDYPGKIAAILFTQGCNFRCGYCHNPELLNINAQLHQGFTLDAFFEFLNTRKGKLDGVVITGGEPCLQPDLIKVISEIKDMGFLVKLDTNGSFPNVINKLLTNNLIDYIAMDIKAPLEKYHKISGSMIKVENIKESISLILKSNINYEFRTTVIASQLSFDDFESISNLIKGAEKYYLQKFVAWKIYNQSLLNEKTYSDHQLQKIINLLIKNIKKVELR